MQPVTLPAITKGIDQLSEETSLPEGAVRKVKNAIIDRDGKPSRRPGFELLIPGNFHSIYKSNSHQAVFVMKDSILGHLSETAGSITFNAVATLPKAYVASYAELNKNTYMTNPSGSVMFKAGSLTPSPVGVPLLNSGPLFSVVDRGGCYAGSYTVAYSIVDPSREESPLSDETQVEVLVGGGIELTGIPFMAGYYMRVYVSPHDGEELYRAAEVPMSGASTLLLGKKEMDERGKQPATRFLDLLPNGHFIESHGSRLYVALDDTLYFSEAFRPHLCSKRHGFIKFSGTITMLQPVDGGIYVSDSEKVYFLPGNDPEQFEQRTVGAEPAVYGTSTLVPGEHINTELQAADEVAAWLSRTGPQYGTSEGVILRTAPGQLELPAYTQGCSSFTIKDGIKHIVFPVNSDQRDGYGIADNSTTL